MYKFISFLIIPLFLSLGGVDNKVQQLEKETAVNVTTMSFSDLTPDQKAEALEHFRTTGNCEYNGIKLYGKVQIVTSFADIKIQYVESFPDIKVKFVSSFPDDCGEWQIVDNFPDFKVEVVESFPDLKVKIVESFPGMN
ncbi:MAG: hypothetical protein U9Q83_09845 [Bacteroidota bacterium]|nr:hypothetical protein [Bacteroidota bacterium]